MSKGLRPNEMEESAVDNSDLVELDDQDVETVSGGILAEGISAVDRSAVEGLGLHRSKEVKGGLDIGNIAK